MNRSYIAVIGTINDITTEEYTVKEINVLASSHYEAHKIAFFKCNLENNESVFFIKESKTGIVKYDHKKGFAA